MFLNGFPTIINNQFSRWFSYTLTRWYKNSLLKKQKSNMTFLWHKFTISCKILHCAASSVNAVKYKLAIRALRAGSQWVKISNKTPNDVFAQHQMRCRFIQMTRLPGRNFDKIWSCFQLTTNQDLLCIFCEPYTSLTHGNIQPSITIIIFVMEYQMLSPGNSDCII